MTTRPLTRNMWFFTGLVHLRTTPLQDHGQLCNEDEDDEDDEGDYHEDNDGDEDSHESLCEDYIVDGTEEFLSENRTKPLSSHTRWSTDEDKRLRNLKEDGRPWEWIYKQFPGRSPGAVQVRWHTRLRKH